MMFNPKYLVALAAIALPSLPAAAQTISGKTYVMKAGASDLYEKTSSKLMLSSTNAGVRDFAQGMIRDHTKSTMDVKHAAMRSHVAVGAPHLDAKQARMVAQLRASHGADRDTMYITQQKAAHADALTLQQDYSQSGRAPALRTVAGQIVPVVQHHIDMLQAM